MEPIEIKINKNKNKKKQRQESGDQPNAQKEQVANPIASTSTAGPSAGTAEAGASTFLGGFVTRLGEAIAEVAATPAAEKKKLSGAAKRKRAKERARAEGNSTKAAKPSSRNPTNPPTSPKVKGGGQPAVGSSTKRGKDGPNQKRNRSDGDSPKETAPQCKKRKKAVASTSKAGPVSYRDSLAGIQMVVLPSDYPESKLSGEQVELVKEAIAKEIDSASADTPPQFTGLWDVEGLLKILCANPATCRWLEKVVPTLVPWEGASLKVIEAKDLPKFTRVVVWVPKQTAAADPGAILRRLEIQNPPLRTCNWKLLTAKEDPKGQTLTLSVDEKSLEVLRGRNMALYLTFSVIRFRIVGGRERSPVGMDPSPKMDSLPTDSDGKGDSSEPAT